MAFIEALARLKQVIQPQGCLGLTIPRTVVPRRTLLIYPNAAIESWKTITGRYGRWQPQEVGQRLS